MEKPFRIVGIAGSLRRASFNRAALRLARELVPPGTLLDIHEIGDIPPFNQDREHDLPEPVLRLKHAIREADAVLFATPEYNYSIPGVLKNAIDWASRPYGESAWRGKTAAVMGLSPGAFGTARAQAHLRQVLVSLGMTAVAQPEVMIGNVAAATVEHALTRGASPRTVGEAEAHADVTPVLRARETRELIAELLRELVRLARAQG